MDSTRMGKNIRIRIHREPTDRKIGNKVAG